METILILDKPRGGLSRLGKELAGLGAEVKRSCRNEDEIRLDKNSRPLGILVHHQRVDKIRLVRADPAFAGVPIIIWFSARTPDNEIKSWNNTGAMDFIVGKPDGREVMARFKNLRRSLQSRLPWLQESVQALMRISKVVSSREDDFTVVLTTARELEKIFPGIQCSISMVHQRGGSGMVITQGDRSEPLDIPLDLSVYPEMQKVLSTRKPVAIKNVQKHPLMKEVHEMLRAKDLHSILAVPIFYRDEVIGLIMLRSAGKPRSFSRVEILFCEMVAQSTAVALRNIRLGREVVEEVQRTREAESRAKKNSSDLARMEALFDHASDGILVVNARGRILGVNVNFLRLSGFAKEEVEGRSIEQFIFPAPGERFSILRGLREGGEDASRSTQVLHRKDGSRRFVAVRFEYLAKNREWLISLHDMTEERELDEALRRTKDFLENVIQSSMDAIIAADMTGSIILFNHAAEEISGHGSDEVIGRMNIVDFYAPGVARDIMRKLRAEEYGGRGKLEACYNTIIDKDGKEIPINMSAAILYEDGREVASVGIFQDLRERIEIEKDLRKAQEQLMASQQKETLTALSGAASHELNQPLTSILGYSELLRRVERNLAEELSDHPAVASLRNATEVISQEAERMAEIVRKISEISEYRTRDYVGGAKIVDLDRSRGAVDENLLIWQAIFQNMKESLIVIGEDTVIKLANPAAFVMLGENPVGKSFTRYLAGIEHSKGMEAFETLRSGQSVDLDLEISLPGGGAVLIHFFAVAIPERKDFLVIFTDITEYKKAEQTLRDLSAFQGQLLKNSTLPLIALDIDGKITFWNFAAEKLFGYFFEEVKGRFPDFLLHNYDPEAFFEHLRRLRQEGDLAEELKMVKRSGEVIRVYHVDAIMRDEQAHAIGFLTMVFDLSERNAFEREIREKTEQISFMNDIMEAVRNKVGLEEELGGVLRNLTRIFPLDLCAITIADEMARDLLVISYIPEEDRLAKNTLRLYEDADTVRRILFMDQPVILDDVSVLQSDFFSGDIGRELETLAAKGLHSVITLPLSFRGEVLGTLHILSSEVGRYKDDDLKRLSQIAGPITMALANARLFNQIERQNLELSRRTAWMEQLIRAGQGISMDMHADEILARLVEAYLDAHPFQHFSAWLDTPGGGGLRLTRSQNYKELAMGMELDLNAEILHELRELGKTIEIDPSEPEINYSPLLENTRTALLVPIVAPDRWLGVIILESHHQRAFDEDETVETQVLAAQVAGALRNLYFYHEHDLALRFQEGLIQDANALILILDRDGSIRLINRALLELLGAPAEGLLGANYIEIFQRHLRVETEDGQDIRPRDRGFKKILKDVLKGIHLENLRISIVSAAGEESKAVFNTSSVLDREGNFQGFIAIGQNITRYRQLEKHLIQAEKLATMGQMAASVAHELNNPLTGIINVAAMLYTSRSLDDKSRSLVEQLNEEAHRIETLVHNLMSYSRPSREEMFPLELRQILLDSLSFSNYELSRGRVKVVTRIPDGLPPVRGIKDQLQQVFINLLTNASHACAEKGGGQVTIDAAPVNDAFIEITIRDDGIGIPDENLERLFDPFFTTKPEGKGTGLGLTIVKEIVARHDGAISVTSAEGKGSTFLLTLPVYILRGSGG